MKVIVKYLFLCGLFLMSSCTADKVYWPKALSDPEGAKVVNVSSVLEQNNAPEMRTTRVEKIDSMSVSSLSLKATQKLSIIKGKLTLNAKAMPLNRFVHMALGEVLKLAIDVDPSVESRKDLVTLQIARPVSAEDLLGMVEDTLAIFDVGLSRSENIVHVLPVSKISTIMPAVVSDRARTLVRLGRIIEFVPLSYAAPTEVLSFARHFLGNSLAGNITVFPRFNAILVIGTAAHIDRFRQVVALIDRPSLKAKYVRLLYPVYWQVDELEGVLKKMLKAQGVPLKQQAVRGGVQLIPVPEINAMIVVSPESAWMHALIMMVKKIDIPKAVGNEHKSFVYFMKNARAVKLGKIISEVLSGKSSKGIQKSKQPGLVNAVKDKGLGVANVSSSTQGHGIALAGRLRLVIDEFRNALIFIGSSEDYRDVLPLLKVLDIPRRQVLLEVTVAEVTLDSSTQFGVEAAVNNVDRSSAFKGVLSTIGGLGVGAAGLSYALTNVAGAVRVKVNALASEGRAKVLAAPMLLAMDNTEASIQIGDQIAVLTQEVGNATANGGGTTGLLRNFSYVNTGVILKVKPSINQGGVVQLVIHQEVSRPGASSNNTPPISTRSVDTTLVAKGGETILIGGMISHSKTVGRTKVPFLGDIPIIGHLFSNEKITDVSTELIILITPHIINNIEDADYFTNAFREKIGWSEAAGDKSISK